MLAYGKLPDSFVRLAVSCLHLVKFLPSVGFPPDKLYQILTFKSLPFRSLGVESLGTKLPNTPSLWLLITLQCLRFGNYTDHQCHADSLEKQTDL